MCYNTTCKSEKKIAPKKSIHLGKLMHYTSATNLDNDSSLTNSTDASYASMNLSGSSTSEMEKLTP